MSWTILGHSCPPELALFQGVIVLLFPHHHLFYTSKEIRGRERWEEGDQGQGDDFGRSFIWKRSQTFSLGRTSSVAPSHHKALAGLSSLRSFPGTGLDTEGWLLG